MLNKFKILLLACLFLLPSIEAGATAIKSLTASVNIVDSSINIVMTSLLEFGQIRPLDSDDTITSGDITVHHDKATSEFQSRTATDSRLLGAVNSGLHHRAAFIVNASTDLTNVILSSTPAEHDLGINPDLAVKNLQKFIGPIVDGNKTIYVGGVLVVPSGQKKGKYQANVTITINN